MCQLVCLDYRGNSILLVVVDLFDAISAVNSLSMRLSVVSESSAKTSILVCCFYCHYSVYFVLTDFKCDYRVLLPQFSKDSCQY